MTLTSTFRRCLTFHGAHCSFFGHWGPDRKGGMGTPASSGTASFTTHQGTSRIGNREEEGSFLPYSTCPTLCVAGLQFLPVTFTRGTSKCHRRVGGGPEERLASASAFLLHHGYSWLPYPSGVCPLPIPPPYLNLALTPEPQGRSQGVQGDQADQPQDWEQFPGLHSSTPSSQVLQRTEGIEHPSAPALAAILPPLNTTLHLGPPRSQHLLSPQASTLDQHHPSAQHVHHSLQLSSRKGNPGCLRFWPTRQGHSERGRQRESWRKSPGGQRHPGCKERKPLRASTQLG